MKLLLLCCHWLPFFVVVACHLSAAGATRNVREDRKESRLSECTGPCRRNEDCSEGLTCFDRDGREPIPGCNDDGPPDQGYCISSGIRFRTGTGEPTRTARIAPDDTGIRFSKVSFYDQPPPGIENTLPLTAEDFPPNPELTSLLRDSKCISVVVQQDCKECDIPTEELIDAIGGLPVHVSNNPRSPFWVDFREVLLRQLERVQGLEPSQVLPLPDIWRRPGLTLETVAIHVYDEFPGTHHADLIRQLIMEGFTVNGNMVPSFSRTEFLRREVMLAAMTTWAVNEVGPHNFACKYHAGRARPEEVAWLIAQEKLEIQDGVPEDIVQDIIGMGLGSQFDFTAYPVGSPAHPSWPAMHSAGSASSLWLPVVLNLNEDQICQCKLVDWAVSYARTVAGVHYPSDNIAGLNLGQEVIARKLPQRLKSLYGVDPDVVKERIREYRFDWNGFEMSSCYRDNIGVPIQ